MHFKDVISCYVAVICIFVLSFTKETVGQGGGCDQEICHKANKDSYPLPVECSGNCLFVCAIGNYFFNINENKVCHVYSGKTSRFPTSYGVCSNGRCGPAQEEVTSRSNGTSSVVIQSRQSDNNTIDADPQKVCENLDPKAKPYNLFCEGTCSFTCILGEPHFRENGKECQRNNGLNNGDDSKIVDGSCYHGVCLTEDEKQYC